MRRIFIPSRVEDNKFLMSSDPNYKQRLLALPENQRRALLEGDWNIFEGQFFPEFDPDVHICEFADIPSDVVQFVAFDYGFDMLAALLVAVDIDGVIYCVSEYCGSGLTLSKAAQKITDLCRGKHAQYAVASPDLWNRRQDSGRSGFEIMQTVAGMPPMRPADDRRIAGWRILREALEVRDGKPKLYISSRCTELIRCLPALLCDSERIEDASNEPHSVTHAPEALRYAVMSRIFPIRDEAESSFIMPTRLQTKKRSYFD
jgi:phage terminase large subunit